MHQQTRTKGAGYEMGKYIVLLPGIILTGLGIYTILLYTKKVRHLQEEGYEVTATIIKITGSQKQRKAIISYTVNGEIIEKELDYYSNHMKVGDKVKLYVSKENPRIFVSAETVPVLTGILTAFVGVLVTFIWFSSFS